MIQRIQTVYLFFVFCLMATLVFIPFSSSLMVSIDAVAVAVLSLITVFLYKKRKLQINLCYLSLLLLVLIYILDFIFERQYLPFAELFRSDRYTFIFPFISIAFTYLAIRGIKKDEKLVRSLDRLR